MSNATLMLTSDVNHADALQHNEFPLYNVPVPARYKSTLTDLQRRGVSFMRHREHNVSRAQLGGLICDDLGLGKSLLVMATIVEELHAARAHRVEQKTLVIASANVMHEWLNQRNTHLAPDALRMVSYHGSNRSVPDLASYDVLITTYGVVQREFTTIMERNEETGLVERRWVAPLLPDGTEQESPFKREFTRIVLDEAHNIRNPSTATHAAVCSINGEIHWAITATPVWNVIDDLYALFLFIGAAPYSERAVFFSSISGRIRTDPETVVHVLRDFLLPIQLRRSKNLIDLPPLTESFVRVELSETERLFYDSLREYTQDTVRRLLQTEKWLKRTGWARAHTSLGARARQCVLSTMLRLRQTCVHPQMAIAAFRVWRSMPLQNMEQTTLLGDPRLLQEAAGRLKQLLEARDADNTEECCVCFNDPPDSCLLPCGHTFCGTCSATITGMTENPRCPLCRAPIEEHQPIDEALQKMEGVINDIDDESENDVRLEREWSTNSSKIQVMIDHFKAKLAEDPTSKALIFSQWRGGLDAAGRALRNENIAFLRVDGTVTFAKTRSAHQQRFNTDPAVKAMVCSLNCSSEGINLQGANVVYLLDLWWTDSRGRQAGHRAHRIGQTRPVEIIHLIAANTIEERVLELQRRKRKVADATNGVATLEMGWEGQIRHLLELDDTS